jgi:Domain of unknown function (DUF4331)
MRPNRWKLMVVIATVGVLAFAGTIPAIVSAADHLDAPGLTPPGGDTRLDINDVYAFRSPSNASKAVLIMTVNPLAGVLNDGTFRSGAAYDFKVDSDGDAKEDVTYRVTFGAPNASLAQSVRLRAMPTGGTATVLATGSTGQNIPVRGGGTIKAGVFDDPFFFDLNGFLALDFCNPGTNFFTGLNTSAIVLEVPRAALGGNQVGVWGRTLLGDTQIDRMGRPAINTVFIPNNVFEPAGSEPSQRNAFNAAKPRNDRRAYRAEVVDTLEIFYGAGSQTAGQLADFLLPDILTIDTSSSAGFPNGRKLADDVIDIELGLVTNGAVTSDCVGNDSAFSGAFPYLAPKN